MINDKCIRGFHWTSKAWYSKVTMPKDDILFGIYDGNGSSEGELAMVWHVLGGDNIPRLECYDDAWEVLHSFSDLLKKMAEKDNQSITQEEFVEMLLSCGFKDMTAYEKAVIE